MKGNLRRLGKIVRKLDPKWWDHISHVYSFFSRPFIGSPIKFKGPGGLYIEEFSILEMPELLRRQFIEFCYPQDLQNRFEEINCDRQYWSSASTFLVFDENAKILGCSQYIVRNKNLKLPVEYGRTVEAIPDRGHFDISQSVGENKSAEIYRLRRSFDVSKRIVGDIVNMLFKALWAKIVQTQTAYVYITCSGDSKELFNLYSHRLFFEDTGIRMSYGQNPKKWCLLRKDCCLHEKRFATLSYNHFQMQTYFRTNLKQKRLCIAT